MDLQNPDVDITLFVTEIQEKVRLMPKWQKELEHFKSGNTLLKNQRFKFPQDRQLNIDNIQGVWSNFVQILNKRAEVLEKETPAIQEKVSAEEIVIEQQIKDAQKEWKEKKAKSLEEKTNPKGMINFLTSMQKIIQKLKEQWVGVCQAKELLDMDLSDPTRLDDTEEDIGNLKEVWVELSKVWAQVEALKETLFTAVQPKKIKEALEGCVQSLNEFPPKLVQYEEYKDMRDSIQKLQKVTPLIDDLKPPEYISME